VMDHVTSASGVGRTDFVDAVRTLLGDRFERYEEVRHIDAHGMERHFVRVQTEAGGMWVSFSVLRQEDLPQARRGLLNALQYNEAHRPA
jgi:hypothetical protein